MSQPIIELSHLECVELLYTELVGRVAFHTGHGTRIVPVNYAIVDDAIVWRTAAYSELATFGPHVEGAFEVDRFDHEARQGWSVIAYGVIEVVDDPVGGRRHPQRGGPGPVGGRLAPPVHAHALQAPHRTAARIRRTPGLLADRSPTDRRSRGPLTPGPHEKRVHRSLVFLPTGPPS